MVEELHAPRMMEELHARPTMKEVPHPTGDSAKLRVGREVQEREVPVGGWNAAVQI